MPRFTSLCFLPVALALGAATPTSHPSYRQLGSFAGPDGGWDLTSVDPAAHRLYLAHGDALLAVDLRTKKVTPALVATQRAHAALAIPGTSDVLVTNGGSNTAVIVDGSSGTVRATIPTGKNPDAAAYDPRTRSLWIMNPGDGSVTVADPKSGKMLATVQVGGSLELAEADGEGRLFVNIEDRNEVAVIDTVKRAVIRRFPLAGCDGPTGLAYARDRKEIVSACANGKAIVSTREGKQVASLNIGPRPDGAVYDARRHVALIPSGGDGTLSVIRLVGTPRVIDTVPTARSARTAALDPVTGRVYLAAADPLPAVGTERPKQRPGSFRILVLAPTS